MEVAINKLKRNKSLSPDKFRNEIFIEAKNETEQLLKPWSRAHMPLKISPKAGEKGNNKILQRERPKRKMFQRKKHHCSQQCRESKQKNYQWKSEKTGHNHQGTGRWHIRMLHNWPPNSPLTKYPRNKRRRHPLCIIFLDIQKHVTRPGSMQYYMP